MPKAPLLRRGESYFCSECSHFMNKEHVACPQCGTEFSEVMEERPHPEADIERLEELDEELEETTERRSAWLAIGAFLLLALGVLVLVLFLRR
ncbi:hypothetical protein FJY71_00470 [candidate division WOR-3 bacterium]|nr:hypothetical protein [candidate division WOR-3 bacterium]